MTNRFLLAVALISSLTIRGYSAEGETPVPDSSVHVTSCVVWVPEQLNAYDLKVFEGKIAGTIDVLIEGRIVERSIISIINLKGQEQYRSYLEPVSDRHKLNIPCAGLKQGVYFLKIDSGDEIRLKKMVIRNTSATFFITTSTEG